MTEENTTPETQPTETAGATETGSVDVTLGVGDIRNAVQVIDYASEQGAFKGWPTITQVLMVRNKLKAFVDHIDAQAAAQAPEATTEKVDADADPMSKKGKKA